MAAAELAARGADVLVLEEHGDIGRPVHCTGVLGYEAFDELDLPKHTILALSTAAAFRHEDGEPVVVDSDHIIAAVVDRAQFDRALADRARAAGAVVQTEARVDALVVSEDGVTMNLKVASKGREVSVVVPRVDTMSDAALGAEITSQLKAAGLDVAVRVTNGEIEIEQKP